MRQDAASWRFLYGEEVSLAKKDSEQFEDVQSVTITACPGCKKRCCGQLEVTDKMLKKERKKRLQLEKKLKKLTMKKAAKPAKKKKANKNK